jgi:hypothetical protein
VSDQIFERIGMKLQLLFNAGRIMHAAMLAAGVQQIWHTGTRHLHAASSGMLVYI